MTDQLSQATPVRHTARSSHVDELVTKISGLSVAETVTHLISLVEAKGMKVFAVIDHSGEAEQVGFDLRETKVVIFGSPQAGTPVMAAAPLAALDLPLKVLVWTDHGKTKVSYIAPAVLAARYDLSDALAQRLAGIDALTDAVIRSQTDDPAVSPRSMDPVTEPAGVRQEGPDL